MVNFFCVGCMHHLAVQPLLLSGADVNTMQGLLLHIVQKFLSM